MIIVCKKLRHDAMAIYPFILVRQRSFKTDVQLLHHERIHLRQQIEMLIIPFYFFYLLNYLVNRLRLKHHDEAYRNICFEREAYSLEHRRLWAWRSYIM